MEGGSEKAAKIYAVMKMVKHFSDFTNTPWDTVWNKSFGEVLSVLTFAKKYNQDIQNELNRYRRTH